MVSHSETHDWAAGYDLDGASEADTRRWLRDMGALLALPALWVDHEPGEIATGLLSVLFGILRLDGAYARFDDDGAGALEAWRPSGASAPPEIALALESGVPTATGVATRTVEAGGGRSLRVASLHLSLPWETGLVMVSAARAEFPTPVDVQLLRVAVSQAAIAIHTARRLDREHAARAAAEAAVGELNGLLRALVDEIEPPVASIVHRVREASRLVSEIDAAHTPRPGAIPAAGAAHDRRPASVPPTLHSLTRRELEVLGLLAQGLSNREIAGVMWLSDRTVERHITSLYRKIGVVRRSEATAFALRNGVV